MNRNTGSGRFESRLPSNTLHSQTFGQLMLLVWFGVVFVFFRFILFIPCYFITQSLFLAQSFSNAGIAMGAFRLLFYCVKCSVLSDSWL